MTIVKIKSLENIVKHKLTILIFLIILNFVAHFILYGNFGLYEDDYFRIPEAMEMSLQEIIQLTQNLILKPEYTQGRPLHIIFIYIFSFLGVKFGGIKGIYLLALLLNSINVILIFILLLRISNDKLIAMTGSLCFILFPANTTTIWLTSLFALQTSLTFLLIAFHLYLSNRLILFLLSYLIASFCLLTYETPFLVFLTAPLLKNQGKNKLYFPLLKHCIVTISILALITLWRSFSGESRVINIAINESIQRAFSNIFRGTGVSLKSFFQSSFDVLLSLNNYYYIIFLLLFFAFFLVFLIINRQENTNKFNNENFRLICIGIVMLMLAYPLTLNLDATKIHGTWSRIHLASTVGVAFVGGGFFSLLININQFFKPKLLAISFISLLFSLLVIYGIFIQKDYALNWQYQKTFWQEIITLIGDIQEGDLVLVEGNNINKTTKEMRSNHWNTPPILASLYEFPFDWESIPKVYILTYNWQENIITNDDLFLLNTSTLEAAKAHLPKPYFDSQFPPEKVIFIKSIEGKLTRVDSALNINGKNFEVKLKYDSNNNKFPYKSLGKFMLLIHPLNRHLQKFTAFLL